MNSDNIISDARGVYELYTLIDITDTGVTDIRNKETKEYNQAQNLNVLLQLIGLRTQPINYKVTEIPKRGIKKYELGSEYCGNHRLWKLEFEVDREDVWKKDDDTFYYLKSDCDKVAITTLLDETAKLDNSIFDCFSIKYKNITFNKIENISK